MNWREVVIIGQLGFISIGGYLMEIDVLIGVSGTAMNV